MSTTSGWARRNRAALLAMTIVLIAAAVLAEVLPPGAGVGSRARPYNVFHLAAGLLALVVYLRGGARAAASFNLGFGLFDLYQALAGALAWPPARLFGLGPADHVLHIVIGGALVALACWGRPQTSVIQPSGSGPRPV